MSDLYKYTFAELEFLLGGQPGWPQGREILGLNPESTEGIRMAGAASLLVRGLAKVNGADIVVDPAVMMPASVLVSGGEVFGLALSGDWVFLVNDFLVHGGLLAGGSGDPQAAVSITS